MPRRMKPTTRPRTFWTPRRIRLLRGWAQAEFTDAQIAARLSVSRNCVKKARHRYRIESRTGRGVQPIPARIDWAAEDWASGETDAARARRLGVSQSAVLYHRRRLS